ncbi:IS481 family transposase [Oxalobacter vibrioformis]|uniref:IS481 family transposase n=1 Tax=Oxalobacter vibrioformis TaxID=933080 RepID=A0A9E9LYB1_9BURK|nr:IS481 family transposase [Oxalobacter vibrioformis]WAW10601.1 IS481 family transposase [Oxalobacter vibrioformis]
MNIHKNAKLTPKGREEMVKRMQTQPASIVAAGFGVSVRTARKWARRYRLGGLSALKDASSRPLRCRSKLRLQEVQQILSLRQKRLTGDMISHRLGLCRSSVFRVLKRHGLSRLRALNPKEPVVRYQWDKPGQMLHIDIKKLGRIDGVGHRILGWAAAKPRHAGWEYLHVCVDNASRMAFTAILPNEKKESAVLFLRQAIAYYQRPGIRVERVLTDNGACYQSFAWRDACAELGIKHRRTRPYRPQTNGKAERFIRTAMNEWAYARVYTHSHERTAALALWINWYNSIRSLSALGKISPAKWLSVNGNNVLELNS